ncbi:MAG: T9SS type A sorting domain-containing protein [candidate division KSB1 bacterium]|nr:T9SS type A sorting domain-containing protein [candidate division KSB1 bacterium]
MKVVGEAPAYLPPLPKKKPELQKPSQISTPLTESSAVDCYLPAGGHLAIQFDHESQSLNLILPDWSDPFSETVQAAINKAPQWLQNDLINIFSLLESTYQEKWANAILEAEDPYIDEIAFCIAHLSPQYLMSPYASVQLLKDNATLIYQNDQVLDYVKVVDYGSSRTDPNYYSTTRYRKAKLLDTLEVEVPPDIYYWYIVHPKISDEIPAYIDPDIVEDNYSHRNNITTAEYGYFWRDFLFNYSDPGYSRLRDLLKGCKVVWNQFGKSVVSQVDPAVEILSRWLGRSMTFTSNQERPHQPVRIYRKHIGRCGEYGDMRVAIARAALIPAANVASYSTDHVWNEFWDEDWIHWDDVINEPYMYLGGSWNKKFGTVFRWRSDGSLISVTQRYTREQSTIHIYALDSKGNPIDGARVILYTTGLDGNLWFDMYGVTDSDGRVTFIVGTDRKYYAKMQCDYGNVPPGGSDNLLRVVSNSQAGMEYSVSMSIAAEKPVFTCDTIPVPQFDDHRFYLKVDFRLPSQILRGTDLFDDLENNAYQFIEQTGGRMNCLILDELNYQNYEAGNAFQGFHVLTQTDSGAIAFEFDENSDWYCVFDNSNSLHTLQHLVGSVALYSVYDPTIPRVAMLQNYPNPVNPKKGETTITYKLPEKTKVELTIYNILGQRVKTLANETYYAGEYTVDWDGRNEAEQFVPSGMYICKIKTNHGTAFRKMLVLY